MAASKRLVLVSALLASAAVSACTSTGNNASSAFSAASTAAYPLLPEAILTIPRDDAGEAGGSIAEAAVVQTAETQSQHAQPSRTATADDASPTQVAAAVQAGQVQAEAEDAPAAPVTPAAFAGPAPSQPLASMGSHPASPEIGSIMAPETRFTSGDVAARSPELDMLIAKYAKHYDVPEELVRHVAKRESTLNPKARNGPYWGLMQISHPTARGMGYKGAPGGLLDAETNLKYAVRYLRGAWLVAKGNMALADRFYRRGYYYDAKRAGLLDETGLGKDRRRRRDTSS